MGTTPIYGFPYPDPSDLVANYPALGQQLAEDVEDAIAAATPTSATATVATSQSTTSGTYTDLATAGPTVTITTGTKALVIVTGNIANATTDQFSYMGFAISGASAVSASDVNALGVRASSAFAPRIQTSAVFLITGLTAGSNTFTAKYRAASGTLDISNRQITVIDLGS